MIFENVTGVLIPILIHFLASAGVVTVFGSRFDSALLTTLSALIVLPVVCFLYWKDGQLYGRNKGNPDHKPVWTYLLIILMAVFSNQILSYLINLIQVDRVFSNAAQEALFGSGLWIQIIGVGILVPIMEEYLFRGLVYKRLKRFVRSKKMAVFLGAFIFAIYHGNMIQFLFALPMALLLIWVYEKWGTIKAPIVFHIAVNLSSVLFSAFL